MPNQTNKSVSPGFRLLLTAASLATVILLAGCAAAIVGGAAVGASTAHDRRSPGTVVDDQAIEIALIDRIHRDNGPGKNNHVKVISYNRIVLLVGEVFDEETRDEVENIAASHPQVRDVINELAIGPRTGLATRSRDSVLTGQVKSALLGVDEIEGFEPTRIKVISVRKNVYLMGLVSQVEAEAAANRAARVRGVRKVVKAFEYVD